MGEATDSAIEGIREHYRLVLLFITAIAAYFLAEPMGDLVVSASWLYWFIAMVALYVGTLMWSDERYKTRQFVSPNIHASVKPPVYIIGERAVIPIGSIDAEFVSWEGGEGVVIVPAKTLEPHASYIRTRADPQKVRFEQLPEEIRKFIKSKRSCGEPYYFTDVDPEPVENPIRDLYIELSDTLEGITTEEELTKKIDEGLAKIKKEYKREINAQSGYIEKLEANATTTSNLLGQLTMDGGRVLDFVGEAQRAMTKKSLIDKVTGRDKEKKDGGD